MNDFPDLPKDTFNPVDLGEFIRQEWDSESKHRPFITFLIGAGCSKSAGIPLAGEIVKELRGEAKSNPFLRNAGDPPPGVSEYAYLMEKLGSPRERAKRVKKYVDRARDPEGRLRINWTYLSLAAMVEKSYINRILTTNFDPLIVEALAVMGQPIRTYDLNSSGKYHPGTLDPATIIYLHGQMHSLFLANSQEEMDRLKNIYPPVLQESVQDSLLIVIGYSGNCDPVMDSLQKLPNLPCGLWWSHFGTPESGLGDGVQSIFHNYGKDCHLSEGYDADTFMCKLVFEGMKLDLPDEVRTPVTAARLSLNRITPYPTKDFTGGDPVGTSLELLSRVEQLLIDGATQPTINLPLKNETETIMEVKSIVSGIDELYRAMPIEMAAFSGDWKAFDLLREGVPRNPDSRLSQSVGEGLLWHASLTSQQGDYITAITILRESENYGLKVTNLAWLPTIWGNTLVRQANLKGDTEEGDRLFTEACQKFAEAVRIKPDMHEAFNNWGTALSDQAKRKGDTEKDDRLFTEAYQKFAEAVRIKPDKHEAFYNWGTALLDQAKLKGDTEEGEHLFTDAYQKYSEAVRIKPDYHEAFYNWGTGLVYQAKLKGDTEEGNRLLTESYQKFAETVRIKPDDYDAFNNWGVALSDQAKLKGDTEEGNRLFTEAYQKFAEAVRIKPNDHAAYFNQACWHALRGDTIESIFQLELWVKYNPAASKSRIDKESDFDKVRDTVEFLSFRDRLP